MEKQEQLTVLHFRSFDKFANMLDKKYKDLLTLLPEGFSIPGNFFIENSGDNLSCVFLVSCLNADRILFMEDTCRELTGYNPEKFLKAGMDFWFPLIHPDDLPGFTEKIIRAHEEIAAPGFQTDDLAPLVFEYRFKHGNGEWMKVRDTKYMIFPGNEIFIDKILCQFELVDEAPAKLISGAEDILRSEKSCNRMLEFAIVHQHSQQKQEITEAVSLTRREKEILRLIGEGLSTKMIAEQCYISVNTVETHRRHLLEKLNAKNSMELIKEASKHYRL
jgi:DNA-binding CsgD family transcriptional regulator